MRISGWKPFVLFIVIASVIVGGAIWYFTKPSTSSRVSSDNIVTPRSDIKYSEYSLEGKIITVSSDKIIFDTLIPYRSGDGVVMQHTVKAALVDAGTQYRSATGAKITLTSLKPGQNATFYYTSSPVDVPQQTVFKIVLK